MLKITSIVLLLIVLLIPTTGWWMAQRSLPVLDGVISLTGLSRNAVVKFDERSIPYIEASSEHDLYFSQGYITAAQRMFQMDISRRTALGELSDILGPSSLPSDKMNRTIGFNRIARDEWKRTSKDAKRNLQAYTDGINSYLAQNSGKCGFEFLLLGKEPRRWEPVDSMAILKYKQYELEESWRLDDLRQRILDKTSEQVAFDLFTQQLHKNTTSMVSPNLMRAIAKAYAPVQPSLPLWGSNAWIVGSPLSDTKSCMLASDKHASFTSPDQWLICSLSTAQIHVAGATIPGVPGIVYGRNNDIAWSAVALRADTQDIFVEQFSPQFPGKYRSATGWESVQELPEVIPVRFANSIQDKVLITKHGPLLYKDENTGVALQWTGAEANKPAIETIFQINKAKNWQDFTTALSTYSGAPQTFCYIDTRGNSGYHSTGIIPIRTPTSGNQLNLGWDAGAEWRGRAAFASLPNAFNPPDHFAVMNDPNIFSAYNLSNPYGAIRIQGVLSQLAQNGHKIGLPDMALLQGDQQAHLSALVKKELAQAATKAQIIDRYQLSALESLNRWDGTLSGDSSAATIYESFMLTMTKRLLEPKLGEAMTAEYLQLWPRWSVFAERILREKPKDWLPPEERTYETFLITTFGASLKNIRLAAKTEDPAKWQWESLHQVKFQNKIYESNSFLSPIFSNLFSPGLVGVGGDQDCVNACNVSFSQPPWSFNCDSGPTMRLLVDMGDSDKFYESIPLGESGHLLSSNRSDQTKSWLTNAPHAVAFSSEQLDKQMQHKLILSNE